MASAESFDPLTRKPRHHRIPSRRRASSVPHSGRLRAIAQARVALTLVLLTAATATAMSGVPVAYASPTPTPTPSAQINFDTPIPLGAWPANGTAPKAYPTARSYPDGTADKYYPSKVLSVHDGVLDWYVHAGQAAVVVPFGYSGFKYGTYTVRMRTDRFPGYHIAFLLWPSTDKWTNELDGPENETSAAYPYPAVLQNPSTKTFAPKSMVYTPKSWNDQVFHDYTWVWTPTSVSFLQDGVLVTTVTTHVPQELMRPTLQVEFSNKLTAGQKPPASASGHVYVDRVSYSPTYR
jgi:hypothetical protein